MSSGLNKTTLITGDVIEHRLRSKLVETMNDAQADGVVDAAEQDAIDRARDDQPHLSGPV